MSVRVCMCVCVCLSVYECVYVCVFVCVDTHSPQSQSQDVGEQQRGHEHFEELGGEHATFLHSTCLSHAQRHRSRTLWVAEVEFPANSQRRSYLYLAELRIKNCLSCRTVLL